MNTRIENDFTLEAGRYKATFSEIVRLETTKPRGSNENKEYYEAYEWKGKLTIRDFGYARNPVEAEFLTDNFFVEAIEDLQWEEVIFLVLINNKLRYPEILESQKKRLIRHLIDRILLNYFLIDKETPWMKEKVHVRPLRCGPGDEDELLYGNVFSQFIPIKKAVA